MHDVWTRMNVKIIVVGMKDKMGTEELYRPITNKQGVHVESNDNGNLPSQEIW
jgi:hypothetical protein